MPQPLHAFAAQLDAVAQFCGIRRLALRQDDAHTVSLHGEHDGAPVRIILSNLGPRQSPRTTVMLNAPGVPVELTVRPELAGEGLDKLLGMTVDAEVGDPAFDRRFVVEAAPAEAARQVLVVPVRRALMMFPHDHAYPRVRLGEGMVSLTWGGVIDPVHLQHALDALTLLRARASELHEGLRDVALGHVFRQGDGLEQKVDPRHRELARTKLRGAKARSVVFIGSTVAAGLGFLATVLLGRAV